MPKIKTNRSAAKRFKVTESGKFKRNHSDKSHLMRRKSPKRKRHLRQPDLVASVDQKRVKRLLPNSL